MRGEPGQWIRDELCSRLRAAGLPVGTDSDPDDLTVIDDAYISLEINEIKRWGGVGYEVDLGHLDTFKTDRCGKMDFDAIMPVLFKRVKEEKARQAKQVRLVKLRLRLIKLIEPLGVKMRSPYDGRLGKAVPAIDEGRVIVTIRFSLRRPNEIRELMEFLSLKRKAHEERSPTALREVS